MPTIGQPRVHSILLVDDHPTMLRMMKHSLQELHLPIHTASTGNEALEKAMSLRPSIIVLDIMLSDINGMEVCHRIQGNPDMPRCSIIFLSSLTDLESKIESFARGGVDFINKPFEPAELRARVNAQLHIRMLEERLEQKNIQLEYSNQQILETLSEGIISTNAEGLIIFINQSAQQILGLEDDENKKNVHEILPLLKFNNNSRIFEKVYKHGASFKSDCEFIELADGDMIAIQINANPIIENNLNIGAVITITDITLEIENQEKLRNFQDELKTQRDQLAHLERLYTLGEMAAGFAHEINQPLTAIKNFCSATKNLIDRPDSKDQTREYLDQIMNQAERSGQIINRLRSFISKPEIENEKISIYSLVSETIDFIAHEIKTRNINLIDKIEEKEYVIYGDKIQIQQVLINIIKNSIESMIDGAGKDQIEIHGTREFNPGFYTIIISDNGKGISPEMQKTLFHPFHSDKENGMGIGLTICETIMRAHNGSISFESKLGLTSFYLNFPLQN